MLPVSSINRLKDYVWAEEMDTVGELGVMPDNSLSISIR